MTYGSRRAAAIAIFTPSPTGVRGAVGANVVWRPCAASAASADGDTVPRDGVTSRTSKRDARVRSRWYERRWPPESSGHGGSLGAATTEDRRDLNGGSVGGACVRPAPSRRSAV